MSPWPGRCPYAVAAGAGMGETPTVIGRRLAHRVTYGRFMTLDARVRRRAREALSTEVGPVEPVVAARLADDARRLWRRLRKLAASGTVRNPVDEPALELACWALQLPMRTSDLPTNGPMGIVNLRERTERAAQLLVEELGEHIDATLLDRTIRLLQESPHKPPVLEEAKLLADATNLDDFGVVGVLKHAAEAGRRGGGIDALAKNFAKQLEYGYWQARLADGFHFAASRSIARRRLDNARRLFGMLDEERREDDTGASR